MALSVISWALAWGSVLQGTCLLVSLEPYLVGQRMHPSSNRQPRTDQEQELRKTVNSQSQTTTKEAYGVTNTHFLRWLQATESLVLGASVVCRRTPFMLPFMCLIFLV